jgi:hypothetical protein
MLEIQLDRARFQLIKVKTILEWNSRKRRIKGEKDTSQWALQKCIFKQFKNTD